MGQKISKPHKKPPPERKPSLPLPDEELALSPPDRVPSLSIPRREPSISLPEGFKWIEGRAFNGEGNPLYPLPNDNSELTRLNQQHYQTRFLLEGNHKAPIHGMLKRGGVRVLDAGCGTGIWSLEMADEYPASEFVAADLIDVFSKSVPTAPPNLRFEIANTLELPYDDGQFDYVFQRFQALCFKEEEWPKVFSELVRVVKPGGWLEIVDTEGWTHNNGPRTAEFYNKLHEFLRMRGIHSKCALTFDKTLEAAGLIDIVQDHVSVPLGWGPEEIGTRAANNISLIMKSLRPQLTLALALDDREYGEMVIEASQEFTKNRTYWNIQYTYGRKPVPE